MALCPRCGAQFPQADQFCGACGADRFKDSEGKSLAYMLVDFAVLPALGEELVFRGVVLSGLLGVFQARTAALVSAMLFATIHLSPLGFLHLGLLGYILARVRLGTGSLWPCMLIHGGYNAVLCLLAW